MLKYLILPQLGVPPSRTSASITYSRIRGRMASKEVPESKTEQAVPAS